MGWKIFAGRLALQGVHLRRRAVHGQKQPVPFIEPPLPISTKELRNGSYPSDGKMSTVMAALLNGDENRILWDDFWSLQSSLPLKHPPLWHPEKGSPRTELQRGPRACLFCSPILGVDWAIYPQAQSCPCLLWPLNLANSASVPGGAKGASAVGESDPTPLIAFSRHLSCLTSF